MTEVQEESPLRGITQWGAEIIQAIEAGICEHEPAVREAAGQLAAAIAAQDDDPR